MVSRREPSSTAIPPRSISVSSKSRRSSLLISLGALASFPDGALSLIVLPSAIVAQPTRERRLFNAAKDVEGQITLGLQRAREVLEKSKAKLAARVEAGNSTNGGGDGGHANVPFFAQTQTMKKASVSRTGVVKSVDEKTGLITADGERMAAISEQEDWEFRSLFEVFENEMTEDEDRYSETSQQLASRDVAASVFNLRKQLQADDYKRIFDTSNRFIGEDN